MKILLFGKSGQIGWELNRSLQPLGEVIALGRGDANLSEPDSLRSVLRECNPDVIINAAAYTAVDKAEKEESLATTINGSAAGIIAEQACKLNALLIHYSTDYVFDGKKSEPYTEDDIPNPINAYGRSKLVGENAIQQSGCDHFIFRTSWVYASRGSNFLLTILKLAQERNELSIVSDQMGSPTSARLIAETTVICLQQAIKQKQSGVFSSGLYHLTTSGSTSWHGFSERIVEIAYNVLRLKLKVNTIQAISTASYPTPANRPANSRLSLAKIETVFGVEMPEWSKALELCIEELA